MCRSHLFFFLVPLGVLACGPEPDARTLPMTTGRDAGASMIRVERQVPLAGVPARGRAPSVVAIEDRTGAPLCTGVLVSPRLVLTANACASRGSVIRTGDELASTRIAGRALETLTDERERAIAFVVLDRALTLVPSSPIGTRIPAGGTTVRTVGFRVRANDGDSTAAKLVREHVRITAVNELEITASEACADAPGGAAFDEDTGEVVAILSRLVDPCDERDEQNVYGRVDASSALVEKAFTRVAEIDAGEDGQLRPPKRGSKRKPPTDTGGPCDSASECAAGVCVFEPERRYCSRDCGRGDRCPSSYRCEAFAASTSTCIRAP